MFTHSDLSSGGDKKQEGLKWNRGGEVKNLFIKADS